MQERKRECNTLESENKALRQKSEFHDDHLRAIDAWFTQVSWILSKVLLCIRSHNKLIHCSYSTKSQS